MLTLFWHSKGPIAGRYVQRGLTVSGDAYYGLLEDHLKPAVGSKRRGLLASGVMLLQHDRARPHAARAAAEKVAKARLECLPRPAYRLTSHLVIATCLDRSKRRWATTLFVPVDGQAKKKERRVRGYGVNRKNLLFFFNLFIGETLVHLPCTCLVYVEELSLKNDHMFLSFP